MSQQGGDIWSAAGWNPQNPQVGGKSTAEGSSDRERLEYLAKTQSEWLYNQILPFINLAIIILGWFSISVEVFIRRDFGERYFSVLRFFLAWITMSLIAFGGQLFAALGTGGDAGSRLSAWGTIIFFQLLYWAYIIFGIYHLVRIQIRNRRGILWHSWSFGVSRLSFLIGRKIGPVTIDDWALYRFIEPGLFIVLALVMSRTASLSGWLWLVALTMLIKNNYLYSQTRGRTLDLMDAQIEQQYMQAALHGADKRQTAGFSTVRPPVAIDRNGDGIPDMFQSVRPDFSGVVQEVTGQPSAPARMEPPAPAALPSVDRPTIPVPRATRSDFSALVADTMGEPPASTPLPPPVPPERGQEDTRPFEFAVPPRLSPGAGSGTAASASAPNLTRYWPVGAAVMALVAILAVSFVWMDRSGPGVQASPTASGESQAGALARLATAVGEIAPAGDASQPIAAPARTIQPDVAAPIIPPRAENAPQAGVGIAATSVPTLVPTEAPTPLPTAAPTEAPTEVPFVAAPIPAERIAVSASTTAPAGVDACNQPVSYPADNLKDGDTATAWRTLGDGVGARLRLAFDTAVKVTEIQILAGYAKNDPCANNVDRWPQGYRASVIDVRFSDGSSETHNLADVRELQPITLRQPVSTQWVEITIRETRAPTASQKAPNPYAAISEIRVIGGQP